MSSSKPGSKSGSLAMGVLFLILTVAWTARSTATVITPDSYEPDNAWTNASALTPSDWQDHTIHVVTDLDFTSFTAQAGHVYRMETYDLTDALDTFMVLYDSSGTGVLAVNDDKITGDVSSMITWTNSAAIVTNWFVRVCSWGFLSTGTYSMAVTDVTGLGPDAWEPDNIPAQASIVTSGTIQTNHTLHATNDVDYIRFNQTSNHVYRLATLNHTPTLDIAINFYDQTGTNLLATMDDGGNGESETAIWEPDYTGIGFASVYGLFQHFGLYSLTFDDLGAAVSPVTNAFIPEPIFGSPAIGADGTIYIGAGTSLYAIVAATGATSHVWHVNGAVSAPAIGVDGTIYAGSSDGHVYAFAPNGTTGHVWDANSAYPFSALAIGADGTIYASGITYILALNPDGTTNHVWNFGSLFINVYTPPTVGINGTIYVGSVLGGLYALGPQGTIEGMWSLGSGGPGAVYPISPAAIGSDGTVYVCAVDSNLYACATDGTIAHTWPVGISMASPVIGADGTIYVISTDGNMYGLNPNGAIKHTWNIGNYATMFSAPVIGADGTIYAPSSSGHLFALNPNGTVRWASPGINAQFASPTIAPNGTLYFPNIDGRLLAFPGTGGLGNTPWPKFNHDIRNTGRSYHRTNKADFDGDGKADPAVFRSANGGWGVLLSGSAHAQASVSGWGSGSQSVAADYDGDGKNDPAVYLNGTWQAWLSGSGYAPVALSGFGGSGQTPIVADYDGDGKADPAVYVASTGTWKVLLSGSGYAMATLAGFGGAGSVTVPRDFDGDSKADPAVFTPATGTWQILMSGSGYALAVASGMGNSGSTAVPADYDGDGKTDPAVYQSGSWTMWLSGAGYLPTVRFAGSSTTTPVPADYDGDGLADPAVYLQSAGAWTILFSGSGYVAQLFTLGGPGFVPAE